MNPSPAHDFGFSCEKHPVTARRGMVVTNHPLASQAGAQVLAEGGNAVDAAIAALFALNVAEPMMVGMLGGGMAHLRLASGQHLVLDALSTAPLRAAPDMYAPVSDTPPTHLDTEGRRNAVGPLAVAVPNALQGWCEALRRFGTLPLADVLEPAIRLAARGFRVTPYLAECAADTAADLAADPAIAALFLPGGAPIAAGARLVQPEMADTLRLVAREGAAALHGGAIGDALERCLASRGGIVGQADLAAARVIERAPVRGTYRGWEIVGPPPPSSSGVHVAQMLNILEGWDLGALGFGSPDRLHLLAEVLKIAFADRNAATGDPDFLDVPVARLMSAEYAAERRAAIDMARAQQWAPGVAIRESPNTTHLTVADGAGNVVAATQTINSLFGARFVVPGTGLIPNNYMYLFDPHPGRALSVVPGKRVTTSMAPMMALRDGALRYALGLPGGVRIFGSAMQALLNLIDHGMTLQQAVEAPRLWTQGGVVELEPGFAPEAAAALEARGHRVSPVSNVGGGMNAVGFAADGTLTGAACWRADGTPVGIGGGLARPGVRFRPGATKA